MTKNRVYIKNVADIVKISLILVFLGVKKAKVYERQLLKNRSWKLWGIYSIAAGAFFIILGAWVFVA